MWLCMWKLTISEEILIWFLDYFNIFALCEQLWTIRILGPLYVKNGPLWVPFFAKNWVPLRFGNSENPSRECHSLNLEWLWVIWPSLCINSSPCPRGVPSILSTFLELKLSAHIKMEVFVECALVWWEIKGKRLTRENHKSMKWLQNWLRMSSREWEAGGEIEAQWRAGGKVASPIFCKGCSVRSGGSKVFAFL